MNEYTYMDKHKFCFIMCENNELSAFEAEYYISRLFIPEGYSVEFLSVSDAKSMTSGYNEAMESSDARYKIYIHQDVLIVNRKILFDLLRIFADPTVGLVGMVGIPHMPDNGIMIMNPDRIGSMYSHNYYQMIENHSGDFIGETAVVDAVDGFFIATQQDIRWRDDLFDGWDFYDASQCYEFKNAGYKCVVPKQMHPWCIHDDGYMNLKDYYKYRRIFVENYIKTE